MDYQLQQVDVLLEGGPADLDDRIRIAPGEERIAVPHLGGYEHFERDPESSRPVYRWSYRTKIAE
jgi:hypothetical protein